MYPLYDFGGSGPTLHLALANGFPPATYLPMVRPLLAHYHVICLLPRALWPGESTPNHLRQWDAVAEDFRAGLTEHNLNNIIAVGHSFGGIASLIAAADEPARFRALCLLDPTVFAHEWMAGMAQMQTDGSIRDLPLAQGARRRRRSFDSAEAAFINFRGKSSFSDWPDETVHLYAEQGTRPTAEGVELVWPPEWEAHYYMTGYTETWNVLPRLRGLLPMLTLRGASSDTLTPEVAAEIRQILPDMAYGEIPGGHLFPQSNPTATAQHILDWLKQLP